MDADHRKGLTREISMLQTKPTLLDWSLIGLLGVIWGGSFFFHAVIVKALHPILVVFLRVAIAACVLWIILVVKKQTMPRSLSLWQMFITMGCLNNAIPFMCIVWGQQHIASGLAAVLNATTPLFTVIFAAWLLNDESISVSKIVGVILGAIGVAIMMSNDLGAGFSPSLIGQGLILAAAISYAFAAIYGRRFKRMGISALMTATGQVTGSSLILIPFVLLYKPAQHIADATAAVWLSVIALAIVCTAFAYLLYFRILAAVGATNLALVTFVVPVSALLLGGLFLQEQIAVIQWVGIAVVALSLIVIDGRLLKMGT